MAEIRSTMDMVMERAAKMAERAGEPTSDDTAKKKGMRLAADYLKASGGSLMEEVQKEPAGKQSALLQGITETLLRNIVLPRDEHLQEMSEKVLDAISELSAGAAGDICSELHQILGQYSQHKEQMQTQLEDAIRSQLQQKLAEQGTELTEEMSINPAMHPQYAEELSKMLANLNNQYNEAIDQRKELLRRRLIPASS